MTKKEWYEMNKKVFSKAKDGQPCPCCGLGASTRDRVNYEDCCKDWWEKLRASAEDQDELTSTVQWPKLKEELRNDLLQDIATLLVEHEDNTDDLNKTGCIVQFYNKDDTEEFFEYNGLEFEKWEEDWTIEKVKKD